MFEQEYTTQGKNNMGLRPYSESIIKYLKQTTKSNFEITGTGPKPNIFNSDAQGLLGREGYTSWEDIIEINKCGRWNLFRKIFPKETKIASLFCNYGTPGEPDSTKITTHNLRLLPISKVEQLATEVEVSN